MVWTICLLLLERDNIPVIPHMGGGFFGQLVGWVMVGWVLVGWFFRCDGYERFVGYDDGCDGYDGYDGYDFE